MTEPSPSGNRWEPGGAGEPAEPAAPSVDAATPETDVGDATVPPAAQIAAPPWLTKARLVAAGAAGAIFLGGGTVGYLVGHAVGDDSPVAQFPGLPDRYGDGDGPGFGGPGFDGQPGQGSPGSSGTEDGLSGSADGDTT